MAASGVAAARGAGVGGFGSIHGAPDNDHARRVLLKGGAASLAAGTLPRPAMANGHRLDPIPTIQLGAITGNDPMAMEHWARWLGRPQDHDLLAFNQTDWRQLEASIDFITGIGRLVLARGRKVQWSVPVGGWSAYDSVASGERDTLYLSVAKTILAAYGEGASRICIRPPWEFNLEDQTLAARSVYGVWDGRSYIAAYRRIVGIFRRVSPRFYFDWCPNIGVGQLDPELCYPGDDVVDVVSVDVYYRGRYDDQARDDSGVSIFHYRKNQPRGLDWLDGFARAHGKLIGVSEWGVDSSRATVFTEMLIGWIKGLGPRLSHHNYWDRTDGGVNSRLSGGGLPGIGAVYRRAFGGGPPRRPAPWP